MDLNSYSAGDHKFTAVLKTFEIPEGLTGTGLHGIIRQATIIKIKATVQHCGRRAHVARACKLFRSVGAGYAQSTIRSSNRWSR